MLFDLRDQMILYRQTSLLSSQCRRYKLNEYLFNSAEKTFIAHLDGKCGYARALTFSLPHGSVTTPVYMPVGTKGAIKGITNLQLQQMNCMIMLANTYHIANKPGAQFLAKIGGLHRFISWKNNILTDSGGYQMVSLGELCEVTEEGVKFQNPYDHSSMFIGPQESIFIQNQIGSDIMMALDDVIRPTSQRQRLAESMKRTVRWIDRNIQSNKNPGTQTIFPIVQGGLDFQLRRQCLKEMMARQTSGYAIGGLSGGQAKQDFFKIVRLCCSLLPEDKPRYLMGVGYPVDLVLCVILGVDMFDCVFATRTARFGTAFTSNGPIKVKHRKYEQDFSPIQRECPCEGCTNFTKAYLHFIHKQQNVGHLLSIHNVTFIFRLMEQMRAAIIQGTISQWVRQFLNNYYSNQKEIPHWVGIALNEAQIDVKLDYPWSNKGNEDNQDN